MKGKKGQNSLLAMSFRVLTQPILYGVFPRLCLVGLRFSQPFLIERSIKFSVEPPSRWNSNVGYGLIGAYILVYVGMAVSHAKCRTHKAALLT